MLEQYTEGLFGLLQVLPAPGSPEELGAETDSEFFVFLSDYYNNNAHDLLTLFYLTPESEGVEPIPDAIQANGLHKGDLFMAVPTRRSKSLVHVICAAAFSMFSFSIDGVNLQIVEVDSTAVVPLTVPSFNINVAQRVSFIVDWSTLTLANGSGVFLRASAMTDMYALDVTGYIPPYESSMLVSAPQPLDPDYTAVFQFTPIAPDGTGAVLPMYAANGSYGTPPVAPPIPAPQAPSPYAGIDPSNIDTNIFDAIPAVPLHMPPGSHQLYLEILFWVDEVTMVNRGHFNGISHTHNMEGGMMPSLYDKSVYGTPYGTASSNTPGEYSLSAYKPFGYAPTGEKLPPKPIAFSDEAHYLLPPGAVVVVVINNTDSGEHPIHFHGHTVWVLASSERPDQEVTRAQLNSVPRRDTVSITGLGWVKVAFIAENPGIWAIHCHIEWHVATGLFVEFYEGLAALDGMPVPPSHQANCNLPPPGRASWIDPVSARNSSSAAFVDATAVSAMACAGGAATRPCTLLERNATAGGAAESCVCPGTAQDPAGGAPSAASSFVFDIEHYVVPQPLVPGALKLLFSVNGQSPGPTLEVTEGDMVSVTATNLMDEESTALQFPGMDLVLTPFAAGVPTVSQCSLQPGNTLALTFRAARAGVYMYRGSYNEQDVDGLVGALLVRPRADAPPQTLPPDALTEYVLVLGEHFVQNAHDTVSAFFRTPASAGVPPVPNALTVNGNLTGTLFFDAVARSEKTMLHLLGGHAVSVLDVSIDGVALQVVAVDGTALARPFLSLTSVTVAAGQRVSVLVDWSSLPPVPQVLGAPAGQGVFLRVKARTAAFLVPNPATFINRVDANVPNLKPLNPLFLAAFYFSGGRGRPVVPYYNASGPGVPAAPVGATAPADANLLDARPALPVAVPAVSHELYLELAPVVSAATGVTSGAFNGIPYSPEIDGTGGLVPMLWRYQTFGSNGGALPVDPAAFPRPARGSVAAATAAGVAGAAPPPAAAVTFDADAHYLVPRGAVVAILVNNTFARERPVRADGHVFFVLSTSDNPGAEARYAGAPLRRDVVSVPARGWARLAFVAENPGVWRLSAAGAWHVANGEAVELFEALDALAGLDVPADHRRVCGMPAPSMAPAASPSPAAAPLAAAGPQQLTSGQLLAAIVAPACALTLLGALVVSKSGMLFAAASSPKVVPV
jgi:FtsP/CotA-like multicopper oxidase with cupredoxin domain